MDLAQLHQFKTIAELGNITAAANMLYISQPALTKSLQKLEEELGYTLFDRKKKKLHLNVAGKIVLRFATDVLTAQQTMQKNLGAQFDGTRTIRIGTVFIQLMRYLLPRYCAEKATPEVSLSVFAESDLEFAFRNREIDLAISGAPFRGEGICSMQIGGRKTLISVPASSPLYHHDVLDYHDLDGQLFLEVTNAKASEWANAFYRKLRQMHIETRTVRIDDYYLYLKLLPTSPYLALSSTVARLCEEDVSSRRRIPLRDDPFQTEYHFSYYKEDEDFLSPFISWICNNHSQALSEYLKY